MSRTTAPTTAPASVPPMARMRLLLRLERWLETPLVVLAFVWLALFVVEIVWGLNPLLEGAGFIIWCVFVLEFVLGFALAPRKLVYLRRNWLKAVSLIAPALRVLRVFRVLRLARIARAARLARGARMVRVVASLNRGMRALGASMGRRGMGYVMALSLLVLVAGGAGMYAFEQEAPASPGFQSFADALWWTAMLMTSLGSAEWPVTPAGRLLCLLLALYGFAVFGYVTATLATFFIGRDAENEGAELAGARAIAALHEEVRALRAEISALREAGTQAPTREAAAPPRRPLSAPPDSS